LRLTVELQILFLGILDNIEASYTMAEEVEDPTTVTRRSQEPTNKEDGAGCLNNLQQANADGLASNRFNDRQGDVAAIQHWKRQQVHEG